MSQQQGHHVSKQDELLEGRQILEWLGHIRAHVHPHIFELDPCRGGDCHSRVGEHQRPCNERGAHASKVHGNQHWAFEESLGRGLGFPEESAQNLHALPSRAFRCDDDTAIAVRRHARHDVALLPHNGGKVSRRGLCRSYVVRDISLVVQAIGFGLEASCRWALQVLGGKDVQGQGSHENPQEHSQWGKQIYGNANKDGQHSGHWVPQQTK